MEVHHVSIDTHTHPTAMQLKCEIPGREEYVAGKGVVSIDGRTPTTAADSQQTSALSLAHATDRFDFR